MKNQTDKKEKEVEIARIFCNHLNNILKSDYYTEENEDESGKNSHIDVFGFSESGNFKRLNLQVVLCDQDHPALKAQRSREINEKGSQDAIGAVRSIKTKEWVISAVKTKKEKYIKQNKSLDDIILLIQGMPWEEDNDPGYLREQTKEVFNSGFKGIYFIIPSWDMSEYGDEFHSPEIIPIKNLDEK